MMLKEKEKKDSGLTLIELIVAVGLFGVISVFVTGAFMNITSLQAQVEAKQRVINDFRSALDLMGKEIYSGSAFIQTPDEGSSYFYFGTRIRPDMPRRFVQYKVREGRIVKAQQDSQGKCHVVPVTGDDGVEYGVFPEECFVPFTSDEIYIEKLTFYVHNFEEGGLGHPVVVVAVSGEINLQNSVSHFQTSASYAPRSNLSPEFMPPTDTRPPIVEILKVDDDLLGGFEKVQVTGNTVSVSGTIRRPEGSELFIDRIRIRNNLYPNDSIVLDLPCDDPDKSNSVSLGASFSTQAEWFNENWPYRFKITSKNTQVSNENTNLYFDLSKAPSGFWGKVGAGGGDIRVAKANGEEVAREISGFSKSDQKGSLFFDSTGLSKSVDTDWYVYYGNSAAVEPASDSTYGKYNVWDSGYVGVWHLNESYFDTSVEKTAPISLMVGIQMVRGSNEAVMGQASWDNLIDNTHIHIQEESLEINSAYRIHSESVDMKTSASWSNKAGSSIGLLAFPLDGSTVGMNRVQQAFGVKSVNLGQKPSPGNILVAVSVHRQYGINPQIDGEGWNKVIDRCYAVRNGGCGPAVSDFRRGMAVWWKEAGDDEPLDISVEWESTETGVDVTRTAFLVQEFGVPPGTIVGSPQSIYNDSLTGMVMRLTTVPGPLVYSSTKNSGLVGRLYGLVDENPNVAGKLTGSLKFNGVDNFISIPDHSSNSLAGEDQFTLSAWVYPTGIDFDPGGTDFGIISKAHEAEKNRERYHLGVTSLGGINVRRNIGTGDSNTTQANISSGSGVVNNQWQYIIGKYDGPAGLLEGLVEALKVTDQTSVTGKIYKSDRALVFGKRYDQRYFSGRIDEIRISKVARSLDWIKTEYNNQKDQEAFWRIGSEETESEPFFEEGGLVSKPLPLDQIIEVKSSYIKWEWEGSPGTIKVAITDDGENEPSVWLDATNNEGTVPGISVGDDLSGYYLWVKQEPDSSDPTSQLKSLLVTVSGVQFHCDSFPLSWNFEGLKIKTGGENVENIITVTAWDYSGGVGYDKVVVFSSAPPEPPAPPTIENVYYVCKSDGTGVSHARIAVKGDNSEGVFDSYQLIRSFGGVDHTSDPISIDEFPYNDVTEFGDGLHWYQARAVNTISDPDEYKVSSWSGAEGLEIPSNACIPVTPFLNTSLQCVLDEPFVRIHVSGQADAKFEVHNDDGLLLQGGLNLSSMSWNYPSSGFLAPGFYQFKARSCIGEGCSSFTGDEEEVVVAGMCLPPGTELTDSVHSYRCTVHGGVPTISYPLKAKYDSDAENQLRGFTHYIIYQCEDPSCANIDPEDEVGRCFRGFGSNVDRCVYAVLPRGWGEYYFVSKAYDEGSGLLGPASSLPYKVTVQNDWCLLDLLTVDIEARLACNPDPSSDFREIQIRIEDDDKATSYKVYKCSSEGGSCGSTPIGGCTSEEKDENGNICTVDMGPADNTTHHYAVELCDLNGDNCLDSMKDVDEPVPPDACDPGIPQIVSTQAQVSSSCHEPGATKRRVFLKAITDPHEEYVDVLIFVNDDDNPEITKSDVALYSSSKYGNLTIGQTYDVYFQACIKGTEKCSPKTHKQLTVTANPCPPSRPTISFSVSCDPLGRIDGVTLSAGGSQYHEKYQIQRTNPLGFSCTSPGTASLTCTDIFTTPISSSVTYQYEFYSFRVSDGVKSNSEYPNINLDPKYWCGEPYTLENTTGKMYVMITGSETNKVDSGTTVIKVVPNESFTGDVTFSKADIKVERLNAMNIISDSDFEFALFNTTIKHPYDKSFYFYVTIPDKDYLGEKNEAEGAVITIVGRSGELEVIEKITLVLKWQTGTSD